MHFLFLFTKPYLQDIHSLFSYIAQLSKIYFLQVKVVKSKLYPSLQTLHLNLLNKLSLQNLQLGSIQFSFVHYPLE